MFLFLQDPSGTNLGTDPTPDTFGYDKVINAFKQGVKDAVDPSRIQSFFIKLEDSAVKSARVLATGVAGYSDRLQETMYSVYKSTVDIGGEIGDTAEYMSSLHQSMGTLPSLQQPVIENAIALSKLTGISVKEIGQYAGEFVKVGLGQDAAMQRLNKIYANAKKFGVDASKLTKTVNENLTKASTYGFKNGVEGLTKMAIQAQKLGMSMNGIFKIAEDALDPEKAIEMAAGMQMLGGNVGALADPFRLMYLAQNDVEGLQNEFVKAASSAAMFNEKTGEFEISGEQMRRLRAQADQLGVSYDEIAETAIRARKEQMVMSKIPLTAGLTEEQRGIIASLAEINNGKVEIQIPGTKDMVDLSNMSTAQLNDLTTKIKDMGTTADQTKAGTFDAAATAKSQLTIAEKQQITLQQIRDALILKSGLGTGQDMAKIAETFNTAINTARSKIISEVDITEIKTIISEAASTFESYINGDFVNHLNAIISAFETLANTAIDALPIPGGDMFLPGGGSSPKIMSEGTVYEGVVEDQVLVGTELDKAFQMSAEQMTKARKIASSLGTNLENIGDPFSMMANVTAQNKIGSSVSKLQEMSTTTNNNINVSGGANVSGSVEVKVNGSGINMDDPKLSSLITAKVSAMIEERLSKGWNQKQGNVVS